MKISFVVPAHNEEKYIGKCLEAILAEIKNFRADNPDNGFEIIVVNNTSEDRTKEAALKYPNVVVVDEQKKGLTFARQAGFLKSGGELIANIDADTILPAGWLKKVYAEFKKNPKLAALSGPFVYYDLPLITRMLVKIFYAFGFVFYFLNKRILKVGSMMQGGNFIVRRSALQKIGGFDTSISFYGEDTDLARRLSKVGDVKFAFSLFAYSSGRRLAQEGTFRIGFRYALNFFWTTFFKKPFSKKYKDLR